MNKKLGIRIKELRKDKGLTQRKLAESIGIDFTYLSKIENCTLPYSPSIDTLRKLARVLDVDELELLDLAGKLPQGLEKLMRSPKGITFLRKASVFSSDELDDVLEYLEKKNKE